MANSKKISFWSNNLFDGKKHREGFYLEAKEDGTYWIDYLYKGDAGFHNTPINKESYDALADFINKKPRP